MAARTTDYKGRIMRVSRTVKVLPPIIQEPCEIQDVTHGETIKFEAVETLAAKLNKRMQKEKSTARLVVGENVASGDEEDTSFASNGAPPNS